MEQQQNNSDNSKKIGKGMLIAFWVVGLVLLSGFFSEVLEQQFNPNADPESLQVDNGIEVRLKRNRMGHYVSAGTINGQPVVFLLDTGATDVSVPFHLAEQLGLVPGARQNAMTANGLVQVAQTRIDSLTLGDIQLNDVRASLNPGMQQNQILLGMSALQQLEFTQRGDWLLLRYL